MKKVVGVAVASFAFGVASQAVALELGAGFSGSANVAISSNYIWRGVSQTSNEAALQGGLDLSHRSGFYVGTWVSTVKFKSAPDAKAEQDVYVGYQFSKNDFSLNINYLKYIYARQNTLNFAETHLSVGYGNDKAGQFELGGDYSADVPAIGTSLNYYFSYRYKLPKEVELKALVGEYDFKDKGTLGGSDAKYSYYSLTFSKSLFGIDSSLSYSGSNIDDKHCRAFTASDHYCGNRLVLSLSKSFQ